MAGWTVRCLLLCAAVLCSCFFPVTGDCTIPTHYTGDWYWLNDNGGEGEVRVTSEDWGEDFTCDQIKMENSSKLDAFRSTLLVKKKFGASCYVCVDVLYRTPNVLHVREGGCHDDNTDFENKCPGIKTSPRMDETLTYFRQTLLQVSCRNTFVGIYNFAYVVKGGLCDNAGSFIEARELPAAESPANNDFTMHFEYCSGVSGSATRTFRFECMGNWIANVGRQGYLFAAIMDTQEKRNDLRFRCLMTQVFQTGEFRWVMSAYSRCSQLFSLTNAPIQLILKKRE